MNYEKLLNILFDGNTLVIDKTKEAIKVIFNETEIDVTTQFGHESNQNLKKKTTRLDRPILVFNILKIDLRF